jgi:hypothetical protein
MIFFAGFRETLLFARQYVAKHKTNKKWKNAKNSSIFPAKNSRFPAKTPKKRPVFSVSTNLRLAPRWV